LKMTTKSNKTNVWSIFGQIDAVVAQMMVDEGKFNKIEGEDIPATAKFDELGRQAKFAVVVPAKHEAEFNKRVRDLAA
jgi:hypothetical protein